MSDDRDVTEEHRWFAERFERLGRIKAPSLEAQIVSTDTDRRRHHRWLLAAVASFALVVAGVGAVVWLTNVDDGDTVVVPAASKSSTTFPAPSSTIASEFGRLVVSQFQTECCYTEGSTGVLEVRDANGERVGERVEAGPLVRVPSDAGGFGFVSAFPDTHLAPGSYRVSVWQVVWPGTLDDADTMEQMDRCTTNIKIVAGEVVEVVAQWKPSTCLSFAPATGHVAPPMTVTCGSANLASTASLFAANTELLKAEENAALESVRREAPEFVESYEWSIVKNVPGEIVLLGTVVDYMAGEPYMAFARVGSDAQWGSCDLRVMADGFEASQFQWKPAEATDSADVHVAAVVCGGGSRSVPVFVETQHIVVVAFLVEIVRDNDTDCRPEGHVFESAVDLTLPIGVRPVIDAGTENGRLLLGAGVSIYDAKEFCELTVEIDDIYAAANGERLTPAAGRLVAERVRALEELILDEYGDDFRLKYWPTTNVSGLDTSGEATQRAYDRMRTLFEQTCGPT